jgi:hypothetical protein
MHGPMNVENFKHVIKGIRRNLKDVKCKENILGTLTYINVYLCNYMDILETEENAVLMKQLRSIKFCK